MSIVYDENQVFVGGYKGPPYHKQDATKRYLSHYENYLYLAFIQENTKDRAERAQATKELTMCEKKMAHWQHHVNYDHAAALQGIMELKKKWSKK
jgi:hypothetical protein